jgi:hypothetical protein
MIKEKMLVFFRLKRTFKTLIKPLLSQVVYEPLPSQSAFRTVNPQFNINLSVKKNACV